MKTYVDSIQKTYLLLYGVVYPAYEKCFPSCKQLATLSVGCVLGYETVTHGTVDQLIPVGSTLHYKFILDVIKYWFSDWDTEQKVTIFS